MTDARSRLGMGVRIGAGALIAAAFGVGIAAAVPVAWPTLEGAPVAVTAQPEPTASVLACGGPLLALARDASDATGLSLAAAQRVVVATADGRGEPAESALSLQALPDAVAAAFTALPEERERTDIAAAGSTTVRADDLSGFTASACTPPLMESWLVGGSATTGAADLVIVANPGAVAAQAELTVYGADGERTPEAGRNVLIPAGTQRAIPLAALALGEQSPVIRVTATGAPVKATLQASITRTLIAGGVDQVGATSAPARSQVIPAFSVVVAPGQPGASDATTVLRLLAPGHDAEATITLTRIGARGSAIEPQTVPLAADRPVEVELASLAVGTYVVRINASEPVVAALWEATGFGEGDDFAWYTTADPLDVPSLVAVAAGAPPGLTIVNDGDREAVVQLSAGAGAATPTEFTVPAGGAVRQAVRAGEVYRITTDGEGIRASVTYSGVGALAGYAVVPADAAASAIVIRPQ